MTGFDDFALVCEQAIAELSALARLYRHTPTGAEVLSLQNADENKVFGITFRTPPADSTGVAHIVEHSVLCGSRKYPLKEPFVELVKGSLKTFLNALTYPDKTCYPVASQNTQDLYNLIDVYLDAVLYPRLTPEVFQQEGWHYELDDPDAPLSYKGVVYNEMRGAFSSPERLLNEYARQSLFPDTTYGHSSVGDPRHIPDLTYEQFRAFHQRYYHPSNARIFFYGDDDPATRLRLLHDYLKEFSHMPTDSAVPLQRPFAAPHHVRRWYPADPRMPTSKKSFATVNWVLAEASDPMLVLSLQILGYILTGMLASPLRRALIESGLGADIAGGGVSSGLRQITFGAGLKGVAEHDAEAIETLVLECLTALVRDGLEAETVNAALNTFEFQLRENNTGSYPRGLNVMLRTLTTWLHGGDPLAPLAFEVPLATIRAHLASGERYFEHLIDRYLLQNPHRTLLLLVPDADAGALEEAEVEEHLAALRAAMSAEEVEAVMEQTARLRVAQETPDPPEALATIPRLRLEDISRENKIIPLSVSTNHETELLYHDIPTNGIVYLDLGFNLRALPHDLLPYVTLFGRALREMGTERDDYSRLSQRISAHTGGIYARRIAMMTHCGETTAWLFVRAKATRAHLDDLLAILDDMLRRLHLDDRDRFRQIVREARTREEASVVAGGSSFVNLRMRSTFNEADWANEQMGGISYLFFLRHLEDEVEHNWPAVRARLEQVRTRLVNRRAMLCNVTVDAAGWHEVAPRLDAWLAEMPVVPLVLERWQPTYGRGFEGLTAPTRGVHYVGRATNLYDKGYRLHGSVGVITHLLRTTWLWERVRVQGGAYGCFCRFGRYTGILSLVSHRDPNLLATLDTFRRMGEFLRTVALDETEVARSIIGRIADLDAYQFPDAKAYSSLLRYLTRHTDEIRQRKREEILATTVADMRAFAEVLDHTKDAGTVVVLGSPESIAAANAKRNDFLRPVPVL